MQNKNRGAAMVEFAIVVPFFFMLICCIIYGAMVMHDINSLNEIVRNTARYGAVIESGVDLSEKQKAMQDFVTNKAKDSLFLYEVKYSTQINVDAEPEITVGSGSDATKERAVKVTVSAEMKDGLPTFLFLDYFPKELKTISSSITMRRED